MPTGRWGLRKRGEAPLGLGVAALRLLIDGHGPLIERLGVGATALDTVQLGEVVKARRGIRMLGVRRVTPRRPPRP